MTETMLDQLDCCIPEKSHVIIFFKQVLQDWDPEEKEEH